MQRFQEKHRKFDVLRVMLVTNTAETSEGPSHSQAREFVEK